METQSSPPSRGGGASGQNPGTSTEGRSPSASLSFLFPPPINTDGQSLLTAGAQDGGQQGTKRNGFRPPREKENVGVQTESREKSRSALQMGRVTRLGGRGGGEVFGGDLHLTSYQPTATMRPQRGSSDGGQNCSRTSSTAGSPPPRHKHNSSKTGR